MSTDTLELPTVAHIVADLDEIEVEEAALATLRATDVRTPRTVAMRNPSLLPTQFWSAVASRVLSLHGGGWPELQQHHVR